MPRRLEHNPYAIDLGVTMPVRAFNKTGVGPNTFIDSGLFETDTGRWVAARWHQRSPSGRLVQAIPSLITPNFGDYRQRVHGREDLLQLGGRRIGVPQPFVDSRVGPLTT